MLRIENGTKIYKKQEILSNINLEFESNKVYGIVGANGSGKSVLLKALAGYIVLDSGSVFQDDIQIRAKGNFIEKAGIAMNNTGFISYLTLRENLESIKTLCYHKKKINLDEWINLFSLQEHNNKLYKNLSLGTKQKMLLIQAFMDFPKILLLDEATSALDEKSVEIVRKVILEYKKDCTIILTSHIKEDITQLCDEVFYIEEGKIL